MVKTITVPYVKVDVGIGPADPNYKNKDENKKKLHKSINDEFNEILGMNKASLFFGTNIQMFKIGGQSKKDVYSIDGVARDIITGKDIAFVEAKTSSYTVEQAKSTAKAWHVDMLVDEKEVRLYRKIGFILKLKKYNALKKRKTQTGLPCYIMFQSYGSGGPTFVMEIDEIKQEWYDTIPLCAWRGSKFSPGDTQDTCYRLPSDKITQIY